ncbi:MAG: hypothetical protein IPF98_07900 [Gemmatimonadetes bacterium]|nr:hypothetical protein [Gemmatimonadota bacterium]
MSTPARLFIASTILLTSTACRAPVPLTALAPLALPAQATVYALASGEDSVQLTVRAVLRNPLADTLALETTCGVTLQLEYADGTRWRPALHGLRTRACVPMFSEVRIATGDSLIVADLIAGIHSDRHIGVRWLAPLTAQYRVTTTASRCVRHTRRSCWVTLASAPFEMVVTTPSSGGP